MYFSKQYSVGTGSAYRIKDFIYWGTYGSVMKLTLNGDLVWKKDFDIDLGHFEHHGLVECDNNDVLVTARYYKGGWDHGLCFIRLDEWGNILWQKFFKSLLHHSATYLRKVAPETYIMCGVYEHSGQQNYDDPDRICIFKLDGLGNYTCNVTDVSISYGLAQILPFNDGFIVHDGSHLIELDNSLNVVNKIYFNNCTINKIECISGKILVYGQAGSEFITFKFDHQSYPNYPVNLQIVAKTVIPNFYFSGYPFLEACEFNSTSIILHTPDSQDSGTHILKLDHDSNVIWYKIFDDMSTYPTVDLSDEDVVLSTVHGLICRLGLDFESCKTIPGDLNFSIVDVTITLDSDFEFSMQEQIFFDVYQYPITVTESNVTITEVCTFGQPLELRNISLLQSPHLYLQAAGSMGVDSTNGIHLRWLFKNGLSTHLPKANYATTTANFNKPDDYVTIYRAPYTERKTTLNLGVTPAIINETARSWQYTVDGKLFYVNFKTVAAYTQVRASVNPYSNPQLFIQNYAAQNGVLEIENKNQLSLAVTPRFSSVTSTSVKIELLSVEENKITAPKRVTYRKTLNNFSDTKLFSENIRSIRMQCSNTYPVSIDFELYTSLIAGVNTTTGWLVLGEHALTLDTPEAFERLEPEPGMVHGTWKRYNDGVFVNTANYQSRWNGLDEEAEDSIRLAVEKYIALSDNADNPEAIETYSYDAVEGTDPEQEEVSEFQVSNLSLLNITSLDYHIARMLGLGVLDTESDIMSGQHVYVAKYTTFGNLDDGLGAREVEHLYCSLPTSRQDERLPLPVDLKEPVPGIFTSNFIESSVSITDDDGYSPDGKTRFITLFNESLPDEPDNSPFFADSREFSLAINTMPVYAGIEYRKTSDTAWRKPELSYDYVYENIDTTVTDGFKKKETLSIVIPEPGNPLFIHREKQTGWHTYSSYGINWFSRAVSSATTHNIETVIKPSNELLPPSGLNVALVQEEGPLLLTSASEQGMLKDLNEDENIADKTLVRLTFEYNHAQELISYHKKIGNDYNPGFVEIPNEDEPFATELQLFFRDRVPGTVSGMTGVVSYNSNPLLINVDTLPYILNSTADPYNPAEPAQSVIPAIPAGAEVNYTGSVMLIEGDEYIIHSIDNTLVYPRFTVFKRTNAGTVNIGNDNILPDSPLVPEEGSLFLIVENMQTLSSWNGTANNKPLALKVGIEQTTIHEEDVIITNMEGVQETHLQKFRGVYSQAVIAKVFEDVEIYPAGSNEPVIESRHLGLYEVTFTDFPMSQHDQHSDSIGDDSVEFYNGVARIHTHNNPEGIRKEFKVVNTENIGVPLTNLKLYISDLTFIEGPDYNGSLMPEGINSISQEINYYPGYKVYLHSDASHNLTEPYTLPGEDEDMHYSVFSLRSHNSDITPSHFSQLSMPALMFARKFEEPLPPQKPLGGLYATRPDFFGKSTYTFTTDYGHKPYSVQFSRASDVQILMSLYNHNITGENTLSTLDTVMDTIFMKGESPNYMERWQDFLSFDYQDDVFADFDSVRLPMPDNPKFYRAVNEFIADHNRYYNNLPQPVPLLNENEPVSNLGVIVIPQVHLPDGTERNGELTIKDFIKETVYNTFVPLTEVPIIYNHIKGTSYTPVPKKQVVRDRNGNLLKPEHADFDMAPMMKRLSASAYETQFTDFALDGASNSKYFYTAREINLQMKTGAFSPVLGPVSLVNTSPPTAPKIIKVLSVLENRVLGINPAIQFEINAYPEVQNIRKITIYRTKNKADSLSIRSMEAVKVIDLETEGMPALNTWVFTDDFADLPFVPYGDILYYRVTVSRITKYNDSSGQLIVDYVPSEASNAVITNIVNNYLPESPVASYYSEPLDQQQLRYVTLSWPQTVYNGKYHIYRMNNQGNWEKISEIVSNLPSLYYPLGNLAVIDSSGNPIYYHYKVLAENFSGMLSTKENILTIYDEATWQDIGGIGTMIIGGTFTIR